MAAKRIIIAALGLFICALVNADNIVHVKRAQGRWEVSGNVTVDEAEERALLEAKKDALGRAGIMENVWSVMGSISSSDGENFAEAYSSVSTLAINGLVSVLDKKVEDVWDPKMKRLFKVVTIEADVTKNDVEEDLTYKLDVNGIESVYREGEHFKCSFKVYGSDSYVKLFWFTNDEAAMIYPNDYEGNMLFTTGGSYTFPVTEDIDLVMEKSRKDIQTEFINVIVLATKKDFPYLGNMDFQSILSWIYNIPADQRTMHHEAIVIK